jgi:hypothetical protein
MFRGFSRPSSGAQWLQWQPLVLSSYRGDSRAVFVVGPVGRPARPRWMLSVTPCLCRSRRTLTLILLTWRIWWAPNNASRWQMGFNSAFKGLIKFYKCHWIFNLTLWTWRKRCQLNVIIQFSFRSTPEKWENASTYSVFFTAVPCILILSKFLFTKWCTRILI